MVIGTAARWFINTTIDVYRVNQLQHMNVIWSQVWYYLVVSWLDGMGMGFEPKMNKLFYIIFSDTLICTWGWHPSCHLWVCHCLWYTNYVYYSWHTTHQTHSKTTNHNNTASLPTKWPIPQCKTDWTRHAPNGIPWNRIKSNVSSCLPWQTTINSQTNRQYLWLTDLCINSLMNPKSLYIHCYVTFCWYMHNVILYFNLNNCKSIHLAIQHSTWTRQHRHHHKGHHFHKWQQVILL